MEILCSVSANPEVEAVVGGRTETHEIVDYNNTPSAKKSILMSCNECLPCSI